MTPTQPTRRLLTRDQVIAALREERGMHGLTVTANRYGIKPQQLNDVLAGRAGLSKRMYTLMSFRLWEFFEKIEKVEKGGK